MSTSLLTAADVDWLKREAWRILDFELDFGAKILPMESSVTFITLSEDPQLRTLLPTDDEQLQARLGLQRGEGLRLKSFIMSCKRETTPDVSDERGRYEMRRHEVAGTNTYSIGEYGTGFRYDTATAKDHLSPTTLLIELTFELVGSKASRHQLC